MLLNPVEKTNKAGYFLAFAALLGMAFYQCFKTTHDLHWAYDFDFYRDMSFIQGTLDGHFGQDPNYLGAFLWYNPLLFTIETLIVKVTGLPIHDVVIQAGTYLNVLSPIALFFLLYRLFDHRIALAALLSYLFLSSGNLSGYDAATYSPWLYPVCFNQFLFYLNLWICYRAFSTRQYRWFILLGLGIGLNFLGHTAPAILLILISTSIQTGRVLQALKGKKYTDVRNYIWQGLATFIPFIVAGFPMLYFIVGKYHLKFLNRFTFEYEESIFSSQHMMAMIRANLSVPLVIALIGLIWFYRNFKEPLIRKIILNWLFISMILFFYATLVASLDRHFAIRLPGTVPSFHYFYYLKALQSVFFGFGLVFLVSLPVKWVENRRQGQRTFGSRADRLSLVIIFSILIWGVAYFPFYSHRFDFSFFREQILIREKDQDNIETYQFIVQHIPPEQVILTEEGDYSLFPVMPTGRKMVSNGITYSNPYVDFFERERDRNEMISYIRTGKPAAASELFSKYRVSYVLLTNSELESYRILPCPTPGPPVFKNGRFTLFRLQQAQPEGFSGLVK